MGRNLLFKKITFTPSKYYRMVASSLEVTFFCLSEADHQEPTPNQIIYNPVALIESNLDCYHRSFT